MSEQETFTRDSDGAKFEQREINGSLVVISSAPPKPKVIDLSSIVGSDIICEFSDDGERWCLERLGEIKNGKYYDFYAGDHWAHCRIAERWHPWLGEQSCPIPAGLRYRYMLSDNPEQVYEFKEAVPVVGSWRWWDGFSKIIAWEVAGPLDGWEYG